MIIGTGSAFNQYNQINKMSNGENKAQGFGDVLKKTLEKATQEMRQNEQLVQEKTVGEVDITKLVTDTSQLEVSLNLITSLRDKVVSLLTEMQKMTI